MRRYKLTGLYRRVSPFAVLCLVTGLVLAIAAAGCVTTKESAAVSSKAVLSEVNFFDAGSFDRRLSSALAQDPPEVTVLFPAAVTVNKIPERLDKWFSMVEKHEGTVKLEPEPEIGTRGVVTALLSLAVGAYNLLKEKFLYDPIKDYNAIVRYKKSSGKITRVIFKHK